MTQLTRRHALAGAAALASTATLAACGGDSEETTDIGDAIDNPDDNVITDTSDPQIVHEQTTLTFMTGHPPTTAEDWDSVAAVQKAEEITNIHVDFGLVTSDSLEEQLNLALASGDYPEAFYRASVPSGEITKYAAQGTFVPLDDLIEAYMPNFAGIMAEYPGIRDAITAADGKIYSLPQIYDPETPGLRRVIKLWVQGDWLDELGMDVPNSLDAYHAYLSEAVGGDLAGGDTIGFAAAGIGDLVNSLKGSFEIGNQGIWVENVDEDPDTGDVRFVPTTEGYRELVRYLHTLYDEGLILSDIFSVEFNRVNTLGSEGKLASAANQTPAGFYQDAGTPYVAVPPLTSNQVPDPTWNNVVAEAPLIGQFVMTDTCRHPIETARWMDFWFSDEGSRLFFLGVEGESYEEKDGTYELLPQITDGTSIDEGLKPYALYMGGNYPGRATEEWFLGVETTPQSTEASEMLEPYSLTDVWAPFTFTEEESDMMSTVGNDINKYRDESLANFITGKQSLDAWDDYVATFDQIGLQEYMAAQQAAYDRRQ